MLQYADLEISLHRRDAERYQVEFRFSRPDSDTDDRLAQAGKALCVQFDLDNLRSLLLNAAAYGKFLSECLFGSEAIRTAFEKARTAAQLLNVPLRIRLFIGPSAPELQSLRWETLRDPREDRCLLTDEHILFSRYLSSFDWRPVRLRPQADLRALVVVANPSDLADYGMSVLDVSGEIERAKTSLGNIAVTEITSGGMSNLRNIIAHLREGVDILYLSAHGMFVDNEPWLWLEEESGTTQRVSGFELITRLQEINKRPRLIVLSSCQSAGTGEQTDPEQAGILAALGPQLAQAGIPAVIAMQGFISIATMDQFLPVFFQELQKDGQIDRAMAVARGAVRDLPDWWMPTLFMRLKSGCLWYVPGFSGERNTVLTCWEGLVRSLQRKKCLPILGPGLIEPFFGVWRDLALTWAHKHRFPFAESSQNSLPQVAQYLAISQGAAYPRDEWLSHLQHAILQHYGQNLPSETTDLELEALLMEVGKWKRAHDPDETFSILARLPLEIYLNTNPDNLLEEALRATGKDPQVEICRWRQGLEWDSVYAREPQYRPTIERPLVYHLFGHIRAPRSLVLTEDHYFDYLMWVNNRAEKEKPIPVVVARAWGDYGLLFLGFRPDEWNFRVLFRSILNEERRHRERDYKSVAVQIMPEEEQIHSQHLRDFLAGYFQGTNIDIYWGSGEDFIKELWQHWPQGGAT